MFDLELQAIIRLDASNLVYGIVLLQKDPTIGLEYLVEYFSKQMKLAELNYPIYDKEMLAIVKLFKQ